MQANFNVHFEQKHHEMIAINIDDDIKDVMTRKPISDVVVIFMEPSPDSEKDENDTAQNIEESGYSKIESNSSGETNILVRTIFSSFSKCRTAGHGGSFPNQVFSVDTS